MTFTRAIIVVAALTAAAVSRPVRLAAQEPEPIVCWWRTSLAAVRVGETVDLMLTCAVSETPAGTVVPDQSRLDPAVVQLAPFEVVNGRHAPDLRADQRRFFQYEYTLRLVTDDAFGQDIALPPLQVPYRIDALVNGESVPGRSRTYQLPAQAVRVLSLVPTGATDIRDAGDQRFVDIGTRVLRANVLAAIAGVLLVLAAGTALTVLIGLARRARSRAPGPARRLVSAPRILVSVARELADVRRARRASGWSDALAARAAAAMRIAAAYAVRHEVSQTALSRGAPAARAGQILVRGGLVGSKPVMVSAATTAATLEQARPDAMWSGRQRERLDALQLALSRMTLAQYGPPRSLNDEALDESLATSTRLVRRLALEQLWPLPSPTAWRTPWQV